MTDDRMQSYKVEMRQVVRDDSYRFELSVGDNRIQATYGCPAGTG